jgi:hypothetical protein
MWRQIVFTPCNSIGFYTALFIVFWLIGWVLNAMCNNHFDLNQLRDIYAWLMTQLNATHAINSIWNSPKGNRPEGSNELR